jgi:hypothetical protein
MWEATCTVLRPCVHATEASASRARARRLEGERARRHHRFTSVGVWSAGTRCESGLKQEIRRESALRSPTVSRVKAQSRRKPKGVSGEPDVATRLASNGLLARNTPEVAAASEKHNGFGQSERQKKGQSREGQDIRCTNQQWFGDGGHFTRRGTLRRVEASVGTVG